MLSSTKYPKESWELITWMAGPPAMLAMAKAGIAQPAIRKLALSDAWIPGPNTPKDQQYPHSRIFTDTAVPYVVFPPSADYWSQGFDYVNSKTETIWLGSKTAKQALSEAQDLGQKRLDVVLAERNLPKFNWGAGIAIGFGIFLFVVGWVYLPERRKKLTKREKLENRVGYFFVMPWIIGALVFTLGPMILSLLMSFADWDIIQPAKWRAVGNYGEAFKQDPLFWKSLSVTAIYTVFSVPLGIIMSLALALLLNVKVRGIALYRTCYYLPALASTVASSLIWRKIFMPEGGLLNTIIYGQSGHGNLFGLGGFISGITHNASQANWLGHEALALPAFIMMSVWGVGGGMIILLAGLQGIPQFYYEAATLDGANPWQKFRAVTLPMLAPSLFFVMITGVIGSFQVFTQAYVMTSGGPNDSTRFYMLHLYNNAFGNLRMGYASALAWVLFFIILVLTLIQFKMNRRVYYEADLK
jgi:multiple sugar transport system permease protein